MPIAVQLLRLNPTFQGYAQQDSQDWKSAIDSSLIRKIVRNNYRSIEHSTRMGWRWSRSSNCSQRFDLAGVFEVRPGQYPWRAEKRSVGVLGWSCRRGFKPVHGNFHRRMMTKHVKPWTCWIPILRQTDVRSLQFLEGLNIAGNSGDIVISTWKADV